MKMASWAPAESAETAEKSGESLRSPRARR